MNYENELDFCEYNPVSLKYQNEIKDLARIIEKPSMSFFQRLMKRIIVSMGAEA